MATELSEEYPCIHAYDSRENIKKRSTQLTILYGCENRLSLSTDLTIFSISYRPPHRPDKAIHPLVKITFKEIEFYLDLTDFEIQNFSSPSLGDGIACEIPVRIDSMENLRLQMSVFSENYESLLSRNSPLSLKYLCREFILNLIYIRNESLNTIKIDAYSIESYYNRLLQNHCYWKQLSLPVSVKLYLNGCLPICTHAKLFVSKFPYDIRVLPQVKIVRISGGQGGFVALKTKSPGSTKIVDFLISPSHNPKQSSTLWFMITIAPNRFIFESVLHPNRYIFAPDPTGKVYTEESALLLSRPFYAGSENVFSLIEGGTPYAWMYHSGPNYGIKSVKWSTDREGMFWRWQSDHYHQASKIADKYKGDECYWIESVSTH